jgi:hypothetical protein
VWYTHPAFSIALGGVLPFGAVCIELFFIMSAMWLHQVLYAPPINSLSLFAAIVLRNTRTLSALLCCYGAVHTISCLIQ